MSPPPRLITFAVVVLLATLTFTVTVDASTDTFCDRFTEDVLGNAIDPNQEIRFMNIFVTRLLSGWNSTASTSTLPGLLVTRSTVLDVFSGPDISFAATPWLFSESVVGSQPNLVRLANRLVSFFGTGLGCTADGFPLMQPTNDNLQLGRDGLVVTRLDMEEFTRQAAEALVTFDLPRNEIDVALDAFLRSFHLCSPLAICNDYATCPLAPNADPVCTLEHVIDVFNQRAIRPTEDVRLASSEYNKLIAVVSVAFSVMFVLLVVAFFALLRCTMGYSILKGD